MRRLFVGAAIALLAGMIGGCQSLSQIEDKPAIAVELRKAEDQAGVRSAANVTEVFVRSVSGIGGARLDLAQEEWPARLELTFELARLEFIQIANGNVRVTGSLPGRDGRRPTPVRVAETGTPVGEGTDVPPGSIYDLRITRSDTGVHVVVPPAMLKRGGRALEIEWIDAYR